MRKSFLVAIGSFVLLLFFLFGFLHKPTRSKAQQTTIVCPTPGQGTGHGLQLQPCYPAANTPVPQGNTPLPVPTVGPIIVRRPPVVGVTPVNKCYTSTNTTCCGSAACCGKGTVPGGCDSKPVIYLYPRKDTDVSVKITVPGIITESIPTYPVTTGWQHILAHPNGIFSYQGKEYAELFYETYQQQIPRPTQGLIVTKEQIQPALTQITTKLGFLPGEQKEFLDYWTPRLTGIDKPYVFISLFPLAEKVKLDTVQITPLPDTFIQYIFYFTGVTTPYALAPLELPKPLQRTGFTAFEWGGFFIQ